MESKRVFDYPKLRILTRLPFGSDMGIALRRDVECCDERALTLRATVSVNADSHRVTAREGGERSKLNWAFWRLSMGSSTQAGL